VIIVIIVAVVVVVVIAVAAELNFKIHCNHDWLFNFKMINSK
jgi:hypothetical protein